MGQGAVAGLWASATNPHRGETSRRQVPPLAHGRTSTQGALRDLRAQTGGRKIAEAGTSAGSWAHQHAGCTPRSEGSDRREKDRGGRYLRWLMGAPARRVHSEI